MTTVRPPASAFREAFLMPLVFLTVALAGGLRIGLDGSFRFLPPPLMALVLAVLLLGVMARCGLLVPELLVGGARGALENLSGVVVLVALLAGTAQAFNCVTPDVGFFRFLFDLFFVFLLWNTLAAQPDRRRLLRSVFVVFGWAFVTRYVILDALYDPSRGWTSRVVTALLEGASAGSFAYDPAAPVGGYVAFFTLGLYMVGLVMLPAPAAPVAVALVRAAPEDAVVVERAGG
jgi:hypothetical protein